MLGDTPWLPFGVRPLLLLGLTLGMLSLGLKAGLLKAGLLYFAKCPSDPLSILPLRCGLLVCMLGVVLILRPDKGRGGGLGGGIGGGIGGAITGGEGAWIGGGAGGGIPPSCC
jgi:hypothetical protein